MELSEETSRELQQKIGITDEATDEVCESIRRYKPTDTLLPVLNLLLLERYELAVPLVRSVIDKSYDLEYITSLQQSRFFLQRMSVPRLASGIPPSDRRSVLNTSLNDAVAQVIQEAVKSIVEDSPFSNDELYVIATKLSESKYASVRVLSADVLALCSQGGMPLLEELLESQTWRLRLRFASLLDKFPEDEQAIIKRRLITDKVDEVRLHLARHIKTLDHLELLKDSCEYVRTAYLSNVIEKIEDECILMQLANDSCWDVKKQVLRLGPVLFSRLATPLIGTISKRANWRISYEILTILHDRCHEEMVIRQVMDYLFDKLKDKVSVVRCKAGEVLTRVFTIYKWTDQYVDHVKNVISSTNYLHRLVVIPLSVACDRTHNTAISEVFKDDAVPNVRQCYEDFCVAGKVNICVEINEEEN